MAADSLRSKFSFVIREADGSGRVTGVYRAGQRETYKDLAECVEETNVNHARSSWSRLLRDVFLPEGYPYTVSSDYLQYQIWNALQAFCSSLAGLFASRAVLQGHGVGNASASATNAIYLTVIQDVFSRLTTIVAGYYLGTSLYPEAKTYRLLADVLNDAAIICDTLSPHLSNFSFALSYPFLTPTSGSPLRVVALCMSGALRALCGAVAGGSKAALTVHFATAGERPGDVGDLSAKDGSKETVLALLGMLCGSVVLHYVHSAGMTYTVLFGLIFCHLAANVFAVRVIAMRVLNRQRASITWTTFRASFDDEGNAITRPSVLDYRAVARLEHIFVDGSRISPRPNPKSVRVPCVLGASVSSIIGAPPPARWPIRSRRPGAHRLKDEQIAIILDLFADEKYVIWYTSDTSSMAGASLAIVLKDGHGPHDHLKAWAHAHELVRSCGGGAQSDFDARLASVRSAMKGVVRMFPVFLDEARKAGWKTGEGVLVSGSPVTIAVHAEGGIGEDKKTV